MIFFLRGTVRPNFRYRHVPQRAVAFAILIVFGTEWPAARRPLGKAVFFLFRLGCLSMVSHWVKPSALSSTFSNIAFIRPIKHIVTYLFAIPVLCVGAEYILSTIAFETVPGWPASRTEVPLGNLTGDRCAVYVPPEGTLHFFKRDTAGTLQFFNAYMRTDRYFSFGGRILQKSEVYFKNLKYTSKI